MASTKSKVAKISPKTLDSLRSSAPEKSKLLTHLLHKREDSISELKSSLLELEDRINRKEKKQALYIAIIDKNNEIIQLVDSDTVDDEKLKELLLEINELYAPIISKRDKKEEEYEKLDEELEKEREKQKQSFEDKINDIDQIAKLKADQFMGNFMSNLKDTNPVKQQWLQNHQNIV